MASEDFDRTPPQDIDAEMSVLGSMMLSKEAITDVSEEIRGSDYYKPAHEIIPNTIIDLMGRGEPADAVTVVGELQRQGDLSRVGGASYIHSLIASVPTAANAGYYARIVKERAILRRLVTAGTRVVQLGYADAGGDVDEIVDKAQAENAKRKPTMCRWPICPKTSSPSSKRSNSTRARSPASPPDSSTLIE